MTEIDTSAQTLVHAGFFLGGGGEHISSKVTSTQRVHATTVVHMLILGGSQCTPPLQYATLVVDAFPHSPERGSLNNPGIIGL